MKTTSDSSRSGPLFLNCSAIRAGDVLLTRGTAKISQVIAKASGGRYSHATLVVSSRMLFESDDIGVGYTWPRIDRVEISGKRRILLSLLQGVDEAVVLRQPAVDAHIAKQVGAKLKRILRPLVGLEYPEWRALASAAPGGAIGKRFAAVLLRVMDAMESERIRNPGPFCSQLVCGALRDAFPPNIRCFSPARDPATVGPNDFLVSKLQPIDGLARPADESSPVDENYLKGLQSVPLLDREQQTGSAVTNRRTISEMASIVEAIRKLRSGVRDA